MWIKLSFFDILRLSDQFGSAALSFLDIFHLMAFGTSEFSIFPREDEACHPTEKNCEQ